MNISGYSQLNKYSIPISTTFEMKPHYLQTTLCLVQPDHRDYCQLPVTRNIPIIRLPLTQQDRDILTLGTLCSIVLAQALTQPLTQPRLPPSPGERLASHSFAVLQALGSQARATRLPLGLIVSGCLLTHFSSVGSHLRYLISSIPLVVGKVNGAHEG